MVGTRRSAQLNAFITAVLDTIATTGTVGMRNDEAGALAAFRAFNFERIYLRPDSVAQAERVVELLRALIDWFLAHPAELELEAHDGDRIVRRRSSRQRHDRSLRAPARRRPPRVGPGQVAPRRLAS